MVPELLTAEQLAQAMGQTRRKVYRLHEEHGLPALKLGRSLLFEPEAVRAWLDSKRVGEHMPTINHNPASVGNGKPWTSQTPETEEAPSPGASPIRQSFHPTA